MNTIRIQDILHLEAPDATSVNMAVHGQRLGDVSANILIRNTFATSQERSPWDIGLSTISPIAIVDEGEDE